MDGNHKSLWGMVNLSILQQKKHCHCQFYIFSKLSHEILNCHSFDNFFTHFCIPVDCTRLIVQSQDSVILFYSLEQHWDCVNNWKTRYTMILWLLKEGFLGDCKIIWPSQLSWWCELATVESFYSRYFVNPFSSDKGSILSIRNLGSISVSGQLLTYPFPNSTTVNWQQVKVNVELGEG